MPIVFITVIFFLIAYRFYYTFITAKVVILSDKNVTPAHRLYDGHNYYPMSKWVLFGHHFAAIAGAGPLVGPVLAAQFGFFPGFLWMLLGTVIAGAVHDFIILVASVRHDGKSLVEIATKEISKVSGVVASFATILISIVALAGLGIVLVNALAESSWGVFTIATTIPIAFLMGFWMFKFRKGKTTEATIIGVALLSLGVIIGKYVPGSPLAPFFTYDRHTLAIIVGIYAFFASVLPVWMLLSPRDYLSSIMKLSVVFFLAFGIIVVSPDIRMPAFTMYTAGGGPVIPGKLFPYLFITIACGAISGFHAVVSSGTTPKMIDKESHMKVIGFGAMLAEGFVSIMALIAATSMLPMDYFLINVPVEKFPLIADQLHSMGFFMSNMNELCKEVGENVIGRTGGAVSFAVGMAQVFSAIPGLKGLMAYWYHFAIMFEAMFILTIIDAGTRICRFILQESLGKIIKPLGRTDWMPGSIITSLIVVSSFVYFIYTGTVATIWPMFGSANQLLGTFALVVATSFIINRGKIKYVWVTLVPLVFIGIITVTAGLSNIFGIYLPMLSQSGHIMQGIINLILTALILIGLFIVFIEAVPKWIAVVRGKKPLIPDGK